MDRPPGVPRQHRGSGWHADAHLTTRYSVTHRTPLSRVLLKLSGEAFSDPDVKGGIDPRIVSQVAREIGELQASDGTQIGIVVGGGNIFRGNSPSASGMDRSSADHMGMLATVINALALQDALEKEGVGTRVQTAVAMQELAEPYIRRRAVRHLEKGRVVIFAAGLGVPYFTTDTTAATTKITATTSVSVLRRNRKYSGHMDDLLRAKKRSIDAAVTPGKSD